MAAVPDLRVHLRTLAKEPFRGRCTDLDSNHEDIVAVVEFGASHAPAIKVGDSTELSFRGGGLVSNIESEAITTLRADEPSRRVYSFRLEDIPKALILVLANRRNSSRVRPPDSKPVRIRMLGQSGGVYSQAVAHDISTTGLSIIVDPTLEVELVDVLQVQLSILLPAAKEALELSATIRNRRLCGPALLYGLRFDEHWPGFAHAQEQITAYLESLNSSSRSR